MRAFLYVPEECIFTDVGDCLESMPQYGAAVPMTPTMHYDNAIRAVQYLMRFHQINNSDHPDVKRDKEIIQKRVAQYTKNDVNAGNNKDDVEAE